MKLAIFDMDGTLYNTNDVNYFAYKEALNTFGVDLDYDYYCNYCNGRHYKVFIPPLVDNDEEKIEEVHKIKKNAYSKYLDKVKVNERLFDIIRLIKNEYKIVLVTTASKKNTEEILKYTKKIELFDDMFSITMKDKSDEELNEKVEQFVSKLNEKYSTELKADNDITIVHNPKIRLSSIIKRYILPIAISTVISQCELWTDNAEPRKEEKLYKYVSEIELSKVAEDTVPYGEK